MGASESTEKLGQRVVIAKGRFERDLKSATQRYEFLKQHSSETLQTMLQSVSDSFSTCSPFLESTLLIAWLFDAAKCKKMVLSACKKVLRAPIKNDEYAWFTQYVFACNIWMIKDVETDRYMYEELLDIGSEMSSDIVSHMDSIYEHLLSHKQWGKVMAIKNETLVSRQDDGKVGLLSGHGLTKVFEMKSDDEESEEMKNFVDSNLAINMLTSTASKINDEFQHHINLVMSAHGSFKQAPMKKVERSLSKCENEYKDAAFPKSAKLLDLVRCSVTFNTVEQLLTGYSAFMQHTKANPSIIELARVKNGFINTSERNSGYRDIKINVVYKSQNPLHRDVRMICEVQLLLINYLHEKRRIHKLYSILREETFFQMVVSDNTTQRMKFEERLNVGKQVTLSYESKGVCMKSSVDPELGLLGIEGSKWFGVVDIASKREIWSLQRKTRYDYAQNVGYGHQTHRWLSIDGVKYVSVQTKPHTIKMFKVVKTDDAPSPYKFVVDPNYELTYSSDKGDEATISFCDFDQDSKHIYLIADYQILQKRAVKDVNTVLCSIELQERVSCSMFRQFRLSGDGKYGVLGGGLGKAYFYVVDIENQKQHKLTSKVLKESYVPCFINGDNQMVAVGDKIGRIEIWDISDLPRHKSVTILQTPKKQWITASTSTNNILAIGSRDDKRLHLYDVRNWQCFRQKTFECQGWSLHLTEDLKYITFSGHDYHQRDRCVVLEIIQ